MASWETKLARLGRPLAAAAAGQPARTKAVVSAPALAVNVDALRAATLAADATARSAAERAQRDLVLGLRGGAAGAEQVSRAMVASSLSLPAAERPAPSSRPLLDDDEEDLGLVQSWPDEPLAARADASSLELDFAGHNGRRTSAVAPPSPPSFASAEQLLRRPVYAQQPPLPVTAPFSTPLAPPTLPAADALASAAADHDVDGGGLSPSAAALAATVPLTPWQRQLLLETEGLDATVSEYRRVLSDVIRVGRGASLPAAQRLVVAWFGPMCAAIDEEQERCRRGVPGEDRGVYGRYLLLLPPEKLAVVTMHHALNAALLAGGLAKVTPLAVELGKAVEAEVALGRLRATNKKEWARLSAVLKGTAGADGDGAGGAAAGAGGGSAAGGGEPASATAAGAALRRNVRAALTCDDWGTKAHVKLGSVLLSILVDAARLEVRPDGTPVLAAGLPGDDAGAEDAAATAAATPPGGRRAPHHQSPQQRRDCLISADPAARAAFGMDADALAALLERAAAERAAAAAAAGGSGAPGAATAAPSGTVAAADRGGWAVVAPTRLDGTTAAAAAAASYKGGSKGAAATGKKAAKPVSAAADDDTSSSASGASSSDPSLLKKRLASSGGPRVESDAASGRPILTVPAFQHVYVRGLGGSGAAGGGGATADKPGHVFTGGLTIAGGSGSALAAAVGRAAGATGANPRGSGGGGKSAAAASGSRSQTAAGAGAGGGPTSLQTYGALLLHPRLQGLLSGSAVAFAPPTAHPMLVPPRRWTGPSSGGYLTRRTSLVRVLPGHRAQMDAIREASARGSVSPVYAALDALGSTPWRINGRLLAVVESLWAAGGGKAEVPPASNVPLPPRPAALDALAGDARRAAERRWRLETRHALTANANLHSLRCDFALKLGVARQFADAPSLYFPFNMDFRGRVYPVPPHLNHMGSDAARGLLSFAGGKPLGREGLRWLKVHCANLMGVDKAPFDERAAFIDDHLPQLFDSADRPLSGNGWWLKADAPWQALAAMMELGDALRRPVGRPEDHVSTLPVQLDGSCNGLQHYAALGRDEEGGRAVNLVPPLPGGPDKPADVYSHVLRLVLARMGADAALPLPSAAGASSAGAAVAGAGSGATAGLHRWALEVAAQAAAASGAVPPAADAAALSVVAGAIRAAEEGEAATAAGAGAVPPSAAYPLGLRPGAPGAAGSDIPEPAAASSVDNAAVRALAARFLAGRVDRKVIKQTVMTSVYGVTFIGAREQVLARLREKFAEAPPPGPPLPLDELEGALFVCASYLARLTLASLGDLFASADAIKRWLTESSRLVSARAGQPMAWVTPLGLPVVQPYRREGGAMVRTVLQDVVIAESSEQLPVACSRQRSAFPPNYVHSLDSSHMMLTALDMAGRGLTFTAVHDSYWTHACDVPVMAASLREQFIGLYSRPLLEDLRDSLVARFPGLPLPPLPPRGALRLEDVRHSRYFFS